MPIGRLSDANRTWILKVQADVAEATAGIKEVETTTKTFGEKMKMVGQVVATALATGVVIDFVKKSVQAAEDLQTSIKEVETTFGDYSDSVIKFGDDAATKLGLSESAFLDLAGGIGTILTESGQPMKDAAKNTEDLALAGADLAAAYGGTTAEAIEAVTKGLKGNTGPLEKYGIKITKAEVEARALADGYVDASGKVTEAGKVLATQSLILEESAKHAGEFADGSGSLAQQQEVLAARYEDLQATIGTALIPVLVELMKIAGPILDFIKDNVSWLVPLIGAIAGLVAGIKIWTGVQWLLNSALLANPIFQVVAAVAALTAGIIWAYNNVGWFRDAVDAMARGVVAAFNWVKETVVDVFNWIKNNWPLLLAILTGPFGLAVYTIKTHWDTIVNAAKVAVGWIKQALSTVFDILTAPYKLAWDYINRIIGWIKDGIYQIPGYINSAFRGLYDILIYPFKRAWDWINGSVIKPMKDAFWNIPSGINSAFRGLYDIIVYPFKTAFNQIKWLWNSTVGGFGFNIPSWIPGVGGKSFTIPKMASGGIVTRPTLAIIGEAGPEAVIPLSGNSTMIPQGGNVTLNIYALANSAEVGRQVYNALREYERVSGRSISAF